MSKSENDEYSTEKTPKLCTFTATGAYPTFQAVYICHTCATPNPNNENSTDDRSMPLCICDACAECCHETLGHDVEYIGMGPSYCDCPSMATRSSMSISTNDILGGCDCMLQDVSKEAAVKLGIVSKFETGMDMENDKDINKRNKTSCINISLPNKDFEEDSDVNIDDLGEHDKVINSSSKLEVDPDTDPNPKNDFDIGDFPFEYQTYSIKSLIVNQDNSSSSQPKQNPYQADNKTETNRNTRHRLIQQALELIQHTRDTHWIPFHRSQDGTVLPTNQHDTCELEVLASSIFRKHVQTYNLQQHITQGHSGAEWWVQVKNIHNSNTTSLPIQQEPKQQRKDESAIDLHYDKDEELASVFGLASFPTLSTVTYLSDNTIPSSSSSSPPNGFQEKFLSAPTLVFAHTYNMQDNGLIGVRDKTPQLLISHARAGKHLVFDGRCLHGAPSNQRLRRDLNNEMEVHDCAALKGKGKDASKEHRCPQDGRLRVTFLVNIWLSRRPSKVVTLPNDIREKVVSCVKEEPVESGNCFSIEQFVLNQEGVTSVKADAQDKLPKPCEILGTRILLPFVSSGATWIDDVNDENDENENGEVGLVVSMFPPPFYKTDTALICYENGDEPCLEYIGNQDDISTDVSHE